MHDMDLGIYYFTFVMLLLLSLLFWYLLKHFNYWRNKESNGSQLISVSPYKKFFVASPLVELEWYKRYGKFYRLSSVLLGNVLTVAEPELIKNILVKDFNVFADKRRVSRQHEIIKTSLFFANGETWKRVRTITTPTFSSGKIKQMHAMVRECLAALLTQLDVCAANGSDVELKETFGKYSMDCIARCAFATKINAHTDPNNPFVANANKIFGVNFARLLLLLLMPNFILKALNMQSFADESANQFFFTHITNLIKLRKKEKKNYTDFLQLLMNAELDGSVENSKDNNNESKRLTENEIIGQSWTFFIAGYETTASSIAFCAYELAINPDVQEKLHKEVVTAFDANGEINYETLSKLPYLDACLSEAIRKYPVLQRLPRTANEDYKLGDTGLVVKKGELIEIPVYAIHHSEEYFPNAERFSPERFLPSNRENLVPYTYLPFGGGPRLCIGMRFALLESKLCIAHIVKDYRLMRNDRTDVPVNFKAGSPLLITNCLKVSIEKR